jgi:hypothetical protein
MVASSNPLQRVSQGRCMFVHQNHGSSWWGCLCDVCFASKKSSKREFFVPARKHSGGKLLNPAKPPSQPTPSDGRPCVGFGLGQSLNQCRRGGKRNTMVMMFVWGVLLIDDSTFPTFPTVGNLRGGSFPFLPEP